MAETTKAAAKKTAPKKAATKKTATTGEAKKPAPKKEAVKKAETENTAFKWTKKRKQQAHDALLVAYNRNEPEKKKKLTVNYKDDGTATCGGRVRTSYKHRF
ncbi:MAG: hypothetical protein K0R26_1921 [Bacteroidota bacterium]|jgi:hypothetical protein|nr:hypothetical protein [Bacteroidota bacterium]